MWLSFITVATLWAVSVFAGPSEAPPRPPLAELSFLAGRWQANGAGNPGESTRTFSFEWAADQQALIRRNEAVSPNGRHTDVMLVYARPDRTVHAVYVDNEGHSIEYEVAFLEDQERIVFESTGPGPRFRLWYQRNEDGDLSTAFEIAQPGSSDFVTYLEGVARRSDADLPFE